MIPAILMISSSAILDVVAHKPFDTVAMWRIIGLFGLGLLIGLIFLLFVEYITQTLTGQRRRLPLDRMGLLLSYVGFVFVVWTELHERFKKHEPLSYQLYPTSICLIIGLVSLIRKVYRVHNLTDDDKLLELGI